MSHKQTILVTGGCGYIGSVVSQLLAEEGFNLIVVDNLSQGHKQSLVKNCKFYPYSTMEKEKLREVFIENNTIKGIIHFAAFIEVGESVINPSKYFYNNVVGSLNVIDLAREYGVEAFIFSSTAAVYGSPDQIPIPETATTSPINPYGETKLQVENILKYYYHAYNLNYSILRYFNASGAYKHLGESHNPETHLIPCAIQSIINNDNNFQIYGADYNTPDGTAIRDYIHVEDLAKAHILALKAIFNKEIGSEIFNIGSSSGYSVMEIIDAIEKVSKKPINRIISDRRPGDPPRLIAKTDKIRSILNWQPKHDIYSIVKTAWDWHTTHPTGYNTLESLKK